MKNREMNFIRSTARGIERATADLAHNEKESILKALADMTAPKEKLTAEECGYYATMYLAAHGWEVP